jgi:hypothetical protein
VNLAGHSYPRNSLTNFEFEGACNAQNWKLYESFETFMEKFVKSHKSEQLFSVGFSDLKSLCMVPTALQKYLTAPT